MTTNNTTKFQEALMYVTSLSFGPSYCPEISVMNLKFSYGLYRCYRFDKLFLATPPYFQYYNFHDHKQYHEIPRCANVSNLPLYRAFILSRCFSNELKICVRIIDNAVVWANNILQIHHIFNMTISSFQL